MPGRGFFQGDIVIINFPFSDQQDGKPRPAIVISNSTVNKGADVILAQITSNIRQDEFSFLLEDADLTHSLQGVSEVRCHKMFTTAKTKIQRKVSALKSNKKADLYRQIIGLLSPEA